MELSSGKFLFLLQYLYSKEVQIGTEKVTAQTLAVIWLLSHVPLYNTMDYSMPGFLALQYLMEFAQIMSIE